MQLLNDTKIIFQRFMLYFGVLLIAGVIYMSTGSAFSAYVSGQMPAAHAAAIQSNLSQFVSALLAVTLAMATIITGIELVARVFVEKPAQQAVAEKQAE